MANIDPGELPDDEAWPKAKAYCFDLLAVRARSVDELRQALHRKGFDPELGERLLGKLGEAGLVDDSDFAASWTRSRSGHRGLGRKAIRSELKRKGIADEVVAEAVAGIDPEQEEQRARELVRKRLHGMRGVDERTATRRLLGMLARKGYPESLAHHVIRDELAEAGRDTGAFDDGPPD